MGKGAASQAAEKLSFDWNREGHDFNRAVKSSKMHSRRSFLCES